MQRKWILIVGIVLIIVAMAGFIFKSKIKSGQAGIHIETTPQATVFINGQQVGTTPYDGVRESGEIVLKLVPQSDKVAQSWETKLNLTSGIKTVVRREFGETEGQSSGEILSFEKLPGPEAKLTIVSTPDAAQVLLDGEIRGFTPLPVNSVPEGDHKILITQPGYISREIQARAYGGYRLTIIALLSQDANSQVQQSLDASSSASINDQPKKLMVEILDTPVGYLRVRSEPNKNATELAQLKPGDKVPFLEEKPDWYKIEYGESLQGWISSQYAKKVEEE